MYSSKLRVFVSRLQLQRTLNVFESKRPLSNMVLPINSTPLPRTPSYLSTPIQFSRDRRTLQPPRVFQRAVWLRTQVLQAEVALVVISAARYADDSIRGHRVQRQKTWTRKEEESTQAVWQKDHHTVIVITSRLDFGWHCYLERGRFGILDVKGSSGHWSTS